MALGVENNGLKGEIREMDVILEQFEKEKERLAKEFEALVVFKKQLEEKIGSQNVIIENKERNLKQLTQQLDSETRARQGLDSELARMKAALTNSENSLREKSREYDNLVRDRNELDATLNRLLKEWQAKEQGFKINYDLLNERVDFFNLVQRAAEYRFRTQEHHSDHPF